MIEGLKRAREIIDGQLAKAERLQTDLVALGLSSNQELTYTMHGQHKSRQAIQAELDKLILPGRRPT